MITLNLNNGWILKGVKQCNTKQLARELCPKHDNYLFLSIEENCTRTESFMSLPEKNTILYRTYQYIYIKSDDILYEPISTSRLYLDLHKNRKSVSKLIRGYFNIYTLAKGTNLTAHSAEKSDLFISLSADSRDIVIALNSNTAQGLETWIRTSKITERKEFDNLSKKERWLLIEELIRDHRLNLIKK